MSKEHIVFLFPGAWSVPIGGYKVIYEYANRFVQDGYNVTIVYPAQVLFKKHAFFNKLCILAFYIKNIVFKKYEPYSWFPLDKRVQLKYVWSLKEKNVPYADVYVATAVETAIYLNEYTNDRAQKYYFIQGYETWAVCEDRLWESYKYKMNKIVIAPWLLDKVRAVGQEAIMIYNGFDFKCFCLIKDIEFKDKYCVSMLYHTSKLKGCDVAFAALNRVRIGFHNFMLIYLVFQINPRIYQIGLHIIKSLIENYLIRYIIILLFLLAQVIAKVFV